jgi:hypothetical protein
LAAWAKITFLLKNKLNSFHTGDFGAPYASKKGLDCPKAVKYKSILAVLPVYYL